KIGSTEQVHSTYGRNAVGGIIWRKDNLAHAVSVSTQDNYYGYDRPYQVTRHDRGDLLSSGGIDPDTRQQRESFGFDETGNWNSYDNQLPPPLPSIAQSRTHNKANEI